MPTWEKMMHSHDRTLIARLGFDDLDKKDPRHDLACQYLALPENVARIIEATNPSIEEFQGCDPRLIGVTFSLCDPDRDIIPIRLEFPISKGDGQYKTTIGFADIVICYIERRRRKVEYEYDGVSWVESDKVTESCGIRKAMIEVKISIGPIGDVLRQVNLYKNYLDSLGRVILATAYDISESDAATLRREGVSHVRLGKAFDLWCERQRAPGMVAMATEI